MRSKSPVMNPRVRSLDFECKLGCHLSLDLGPLSPPISVAKWRRKLGRLQTVRFRHQKGHSRRAHMMLWYTRTISIKALEQV